MMRAPSRKVGNRMRVRSAINLEPYTTLEPGELGSVVSTHEDPPEILVRLDKYHESLRLWDNCVLLVGPELECAGLVSALQYPPPRVWARVGIAAALTVAVLLPSPIAWATPLFWELK
jgi:hypothetical protein